MSQPEVELVRADTAPEDVTSAPRARHHWSDWAGFVLNLGMAVFILARSWRLGIFILPGLWYELMVAASFLIRRPAVRKLTGWLPRVATYGGSLLMLAVLQLAVIWFPDWATASSTASLRIGGSLIWLLGTLIGIWPLWYLRKSFSLEPQARNLVTTGPYRIVRHPIYAMYTLNYLGLWISHLTVPLGIALGVWFGLTLLRIHYEEKVLTQAFPAYADYRDRVGALLPRIFRASS